MAKMMIERVRTVGLDISIEFKFSGKKSRTHDTCTYQLIYLRKMKSPRIQDHFIEELFSTYQKRETDITSYEDLIAASIRTGFDKKESKQVTIAVKKLI